MSLISERLSGVTLRDAQLSAAVLRRRDYNINSAPLQPKLRRKENLNVCQGFGQCPLFDRLSSEGC